MKELPELDDDFAKDVSRNLIHRKNTKRHQRNLTKKKAEDAKRAKEDAAVEKAVEKCSDGDTGADA